MRSNLTMVTFVLVILFTFDYFAMDGRILDWLLRAAHEAGLQWKSDVDDIISRYLRTS
jgi:hypothetical protein